MKKEDHPLHFMLPKHKMSECRYSLRNGQDNTILFKNTTKCRTLRSEQLFTFKYFSCLYIVLTVVCIYVNIVLVIRHGHFTLKQLRLPVVNETHTNSYTGPRLVE